MQKIFKKREISSVKSVPKSSETIDFRNGIGIGTATKIGIGIGISKKPRNWPESESEPESELIPDGEHDDSIIFL